MYASRLRAARGLSRLAQRSFTTSGRQLESATTATTAKTQPSTSVAEAPAPTEIQQAPNRTETWSRSQQVRSQAMTGPRFEQTNFDLQVSEHQCRTYRR